MSVENLRGQMETAITTSASTTDAVTEVLRLVRMAMMDQDVLDAAMVRQTAVSSRVSVEEARAAWAQMPEQQRDPAIWQPNKVDQREAIGAAMSAAFDRMVGAEPNVGRFTMIGGERE